MFPFPVSSSRISPPNKRLKPVPPKGNKICKLLAALLMSKYFHSADVGNLHPSGQKFSSVLMLYICPNSSQSTFILSRHILYSPILYERFSAIHLVPSISIHGYSLLSLLSIIVPRFNCLLFSRYFFSARTQRIFASSCVNLVVHWAIPR